MQLNLKTTILCSSLLAASLNIWQFASSNIQRKDAFSPAWAQSTHPAPSPLTGKAAAVTAQTAAATTAPATAVQASAPAVVPAIAAAAALTHAGMKPEFAPLYLSVQARTGTPWQLLAAVHKVETGQSGTTSRASYAGAVGPMQFMPATFNHYALDGDGNGTKEIYDIDDSMLTAGRYLAAGGADKGQYSKALYNYNHSWSYVSKVSGIAGSLGL